MPCAVARDWAALFAAEVARCRGTAGQDVLCSQPADRCATARLRWESAGASLRLAEVLLSDDGREREREVLSHLVASRTYAEIAAALVISQKTVSVHVSNLLRETGTRSRVEVAALARRLAKTSESTFG